MTTFELATASRILFGPGKIREVAPFVSKVGKQLLIITGKTQKRAECLLQLLRDRNIEHEVFHVSGEPTTKSVMDAVLFARQKKSDMVLGIGGGSVLDTGKVVSALLTNRGELLDYLEVIGKGQPLLHQPAPHIAIPTTAGTGSEVTPNAVLSSPDHQVKVSMRSPWLLPRLAIVDPYLTHSMPPQVTANSGLDALTQLIESFVSNKSNPFTEAICREGMRRASSSLQRAYENGNDTIARENMALVSLFSGLALANAKLGAVHGLSGPMGGMFQAPHGLICARLLPIVMEGNVKALRAREPDSPVLDRYQEIARILTGDPTTNINRGISWVKKLCKTLKICPLNTVGLKEEYFPLLVKKAKKASSMKGNPISLTDQELGEILKKAI